MGLARAIGLSALMLLPVFGAVAAVDPRDGDVENIRLGMTAADLSTDLYADFACGANGGPPRNPLRDWSQFAACRAEAGTGLHEVYFRFDDEQEYVARAQEDQRAINLLAGTKVAGHPVMLSLLFNDAGVVKGIRIVTDPRAPIADRRDSYLLGDRLLSRYDREGWTCSDLPLVNGETPIGPIAIKKRCEKEFNNDRRLLLQVRLFRRQGQTGVSLDTGQLVQGDFEAMTRLDIYALDVPQTR